MTRRPLAVVLPALLLVLLAGPPAAADDEFEMDGRLADELGLEEPYTTLLGFGRGTRVHVDYRSLSDDQAAYEQEARRAAELVWEHLEYRVLAVDVAPTAGVTWRDGDVPPAVSLTRTDLEQAFGPRPPALDDADPYAYEEVELGAVGAGVAWGLLGLLVLGLLTWLVVWLVRRRRRPAADTAWGGWPQAAGWPPHAGTPWGPGWQQQGWSPAPPAAPPGAWAPPTGAGPWAPPAAAPAPPTGGPR
jgi:hypothetical protein